MRYVVSGATGLIGAALVKTLETGGHEVLRLVRRAAGEGEVRWSPEGGMIEWEKLEGADAVVHLAGKALAGGRWTPALKEQFYQSRIAGTHLLAVALARLRQKPRVFLSASAVGYYGDRGGEPLMEESRPGGDYLARLCRDWEAAAQPAAEAGIRTARLRFGVVLSPDGGALSQMLPVFRLGLGGPLGSGRQIVSWIALDDAIGAIMHIINTPEIDGAVNITAPNPARNAELARAIGRALGRPAILPAPAFALRLAFGEMADAALLSGARALPSKLQSSGYVFRFPELESALIHLLQTY